MDDYKKKQLELKAKYPNVFRMFWIDYENTSKTKSPPSGCSVWGLECDSGWLDIIEECAAKIEELIMALSTQEEREAMYAVQIKEKFGGLRFYMSYYNEDIDKAVKEAAAKAKVTCEVCGNPGEHGDHHGWLKTTCDKHGFRN
jgi:hypothetical protein